MTAEHTELTEIAKKVGYHGPANIYNIRDWLREVHSIHVEVGSIWDESYNKVESYYYTLTAPIQKYYVQPEHCGNGISHEDMLIQGVLKGLVLLKQYDQQKDTEVTDDELVVAYLKGYRDKDVHGRNQPYYSTHIEEYAYLLGRQGDYIEEGLTDDDIVDLVKNRTEEDVLRLKNRP